MNRLQFAAVAVILIVGVAVLAQSSPTPADTVTFSEHVAPIVFANCVTCHRPGEAAPFSLMTYEDARLRGKTIAAVTRSRYMPPWKADAGDYSFVGERRLSESQIDTFEQWVNGGLLEGDPKKMPKAPVFKEEWPLGKPDLVVSMPEAFEVPASGPDVFRNFVLALNLKKDQWIRAVDFRASARKVVHHSLFFSDPSGQGRELDAADPLPGFAGLMGGTGIVTGKLSPLEMVARFGVANLYRRTRPLVAPAVVEDWVDGFPAAGRVHFLMTSRSLPRRVLI